VIAEVNQRFPNNPGDLSQFRLAVTRSEAERQFDWFVTYALADFGAHWLRAANAWLATG